MDFHELFSSLAADYDWPDTIHWLLMRQRAQENSTHIDRMRALAVVWPHLTPEQQMEIAGLFGATAVGLVEAMIFYMSDIMLDDEGDDDFDAHRENYLSYLYFDGLGE